MSEIETSPMWEAVTDEHGEIIDPSIPRDLVYDSESLRRWYMCVEVAQRMTGLPGDHPEARFFATTLFGQDIPTGPPMEADLEEGRIPRPPDGQLSFNPNQWRNRLGRWIDMPDPPESPGTRRSRGQEPLLSPGTEAKPRTTLEEIEKLGLNDWPEKGERAKELLGEARDTFELYGPEEPDADPKFPQYGTDRAQRQDALIAAELEGKVSPADGDPHALFMAGGPASGKSTVLRRNRESLAPPTETTVHIDVDKIKADMGKFGMPEYDAMREGDDRYAATAVHKEAGDIAVRLIDEAMKRKLNVIIDGTGNSDPGLFREQLEEMNDANYIVDALYIDRPTNESIALAVDRAEREGRWVPVPAIRRQHRMVSVNFRDEISKLPFLNSLVVHDSEGLIARLDENGGIEPVRAERYDEFLAKAGEAPDPKEAELYQQLGDKDMPKPPASPGADDWPPEPDIEAAKAEAMAQPPGEEYFPEGYLTLKEAHALRGYVSPRTYRDFQNYFRKGKGDERAEDLARAIREKGIPRQGQELYRVTTIPADLRERLENGEQGERLEPGFLSAAHDVGTAGGIAVQTHSQELSVIKIRPGDKPAINPAEQSLFSDELIFAPGTTLRFTGKKVPLKGVGEDNPAVQGRLPDYAYEAELA